MEFLVSCDMAAADALLGGIQGEPVQGLLDLPVPEIPVMAAGLLDVGYVGAALSQNVAEGRFTPRRTSSVPQAK